jgi:prepilin-type N-terminal cleavage/methylation domain-containing protein
MSLRRARGFTLIELLIALVLVVIVGGGLFTVLSKQRQLTRTQGETMNLATAIRTGAMVLPGELRQLGIDSLHNNPDLIAIGPDSVRYRAWRGTSIICSISGSGPYTIKVYNGTGTGAEAGIGENYFGRTPAASDSVLVFIEGANSSAASDDAWGKGRLTAAAPTSSTCGTTIPALQMTITADAALAAAIAAGQVAAGTPMRSFELMRLKLAAVNGQNFLVGNSYSTGQAEQAIVGPLAANGLAFTYLDSTGTATNAINDIRAIRFTIAGTTDRQVRLTNGTLGYPTDTLSATVAMRNTPRH